MWKDVLCKKQSRCGYILRQSRLQGKENDQRSKEALLMMKSQSLKRTQQCYMCMHALNTSTAKSVKERWIELKREINPQIYLETSTSLSQHLIEQLEK